MRLLAPEFGNCQPFLTILYDCQINLPQHLSFSLPPNGKPCTCGQRTSTFHARIPPPPKCVQWAQPAVGTHSNKQHAGAGACASAPKLQALSREQGPTAVPRLLGL